MLIARTKFIDANIQGLALLMLHHYMHSTAKLYLLVKAITLFKTYKYTYLLQEQHTETQGNIIIPISVEKDLM